MKTTQLYVCMLVLATLGATTSVFAQSWWGNGIRGEGASVTRNLDLDAFTGVGLQISGQVFLTPGATQAVRVEGQANIIDNLKTEVKNGIWSIGFRDRVHNYQPLKIYITIPTLTEALLSGSGSINSQGAFKNLARVAVAVSGSGNINLDLAAQSIQTSVSGSGDVVLRGSAQSHQVAISGSGNIEAFELQTENTEVAVSGSGDCEVHASASLKVAVSGSGDVDYRGTPAQIQSRVSGSGQVRPRS